MWLIREVNSDVSLLFVFYWIVGKWLKDCKYKKSAEGLGENMLITKEVEITLNGKNIKYYESLGYPIPRIKNKKGNLTVPFGTKLLVKIEDLQKSSNIQIEVQCDYCLEEGIETIMNPYYYNYCRNKENTIIKKDCCKKCISKKAKESNLINYGVEHTAQLPETKEKFRQTSLDRYGVIHPMKTKECLNKMRNTCQEKYGSDFYMGTDDFKGKTKEYNQENYGVDNYTQTKEWNNKIKITNNNKYGVDYGFQSEDIKDKIKQTNLDKYGVEYYTQTDEHRERYVQTCLDKYGVSNSMQNKETQEKFKQTNNDRYGVEYPMQNPDIRLKQMQSMYDNNNIKLSKQQKYICKLVNGELNYLIEDTNRYSFVDIAFLDEKIYIEWDGSGHKLSIIHGQKTEHEFNEREKRRTYGLIKSGWKEIRIISEKDYLPSDVMIFKIINDSKLLFDEGFHRIVFNLDEGIYETSKFKKDYDFGKLHNTRNLVVD